MSTSCGQKEEQREQCCQAETGLLDPRNKKEQSRDGDGNCSECCPSIEGVSCRCSGEAVGSGGNELVCAV